MCPSIRRMISPVHDVRFKLERAKPIVGHIKSSCCQLLAIPNFLRRFQNSLLNTSLKNPLVKLKNKTIATNEARAKKEAISVPREKYLDAFSLTTLFRLERDVKVFSITFPARFLFKSYLIHTHVHRDSIYNCNFVFEI